MGIKVVGRLLVRVIALERQTINQVSDSGSWEPLVTYLKEEIFQLKGDHRWSLNHILLLSEVLVENVFRVILLNNCMELIRLINMCSCIEES